MKPTKEMIWVAAIILIVVDVLTFHDFAEIHTIRDWLTLAASALVLVYAFKLRKSSH